MERADGPYTKSGEGRIITSPERKRRMNALLLRLRSGLVKCASHVRHSRTYRFGSWRERITLNPLHFRPFKRFACGYDAGLVSRYECKNCASIAQIVRPHASECVRMRPDAYAGGGVYLKLTPPVSIRSSIFHAAEAGVVQGAIRRAFIADAG